MVKGIKVELCPRMEPTKVHTLVVDLWTSPAFAEMREKMGHLFCQNLTTQIESAAMKDAENARRISEATVASLAAAVERLTYTNERT